VRSAASQGFAGHPVCVLCVYACVYVCVCVWCVFVCACERAEVQVLEGDMQFTGVCTERGEKRSKR
jgi:hypothetical protein